MFEPGPLELVIIALIGAGIFIGLPVGLFYLVRAAVRSANRDE